MSPTTTAHGRPASLERAAYVLPDVTKPTRGEVVRKIRDETASKGLRSNDQIASQLLGMLEKAVTHIRRNGPDSRYT